MTDPAGAPDRTAPDRAGTPDPAGPAHTAPAHTAGPAGAPHPAGAASPAGTPDRAAPATPAPATPAPATPAGAATPAGSPNASKDMPAPDRPVVPAPPDLAAGTPPPDAGPSAHDRASASDSDSHDDDDLDGGGIIRASWAGTTALGVAVGIGLAAHTLRGLTAIVALVLFAAGTVVFFVAFLRAVDRSRTEQIGVMNLFFLDHSAPKPVKRSLLAGLVAQIAIAATAAALKPNTALAFAVLAPVYPLALNGLWGARHGSFPPRTPRTPRTPRPQRTQPPRH